MKTIQKKMTKVKIEEVQKTDIAGLFTIYFEGDDTTEFQKFIEKFKEDATRKEDLSVILTAITVCSPPADFWRGTSAPRARWATTLWPCR